MDEKNQTSVKLIEAVILPSLVLLAIFAGFTRRWDLAALLAALTAYSYYTRDK